MITGVIVIISVIITDVIVFIIVILIAIIIVILILLLLSLLFFITYCVLFLSVTNGLQGYSTPMFDDHDIFLSCRETMSLQRVIQHCVFHHPSP